MPLHARPVFVLDRLPQQPLMVLRACGVVPCKMLRFTGTAYSQETKPNHKGHEGTQSVISAFSFRKMLHQQPTIEISNKRHKGLTLCAPSCPLWLRAVLNRQKPLPSCLPWRPLSAQPERSNQAE